MGQPVARLRKPGACSPHAAERVCTWCSASDVAHGEGTGSMAEDPFGPGTHKQPAWHMASGHLEDR